MKRARRATAPAVPATCAAVRKTITCVGVSAPTPWTAPSTVAAVPALFALARRLFDRRTAVIAILLLATNGFALFYGREARAYTFLLLVSITSTYLLVRALERPTWPGWLGWPRCWRGTGRCVQHASSSACGKPGVGVTG